MRTRRHYRNLLRVLLWAAVGILFCLTASPLLAAVTIDSLSVSWTGTTQTKVVWKTASEVNNAGFYILRADSQNGPFARVSTRLIASHCAAQAVCANPNYDFTDSPPTYQTYYYKLQSVDLSGGTADFGPVAAQAAAAPTATPTATATRTFTSVPTTTRTPTTAAQPTMTITPAPSRTSTRPPSVAASATPPPSAPSAATGAASPPTNRTATPRPAAGGLLPVPTASPSMASTPEMGGDGPEPSPGPDPDSEFDSSQPTLVALAQTTVTSTGTPAPRRAPAAAPVRTPVGGLTLEGVVGTSLVAMVLCVGTLGLISILVAMYFLWRHYAFA